LIALGVSWRKIRDFTQNPSMSEMACLQQLFAGTVQIASEAYTLRLLAPVGAPGKTEVKHCWSVGDFRFAFCKAEIGLEAPLV
jgi:hypothetical protein